MLMFKGDSKATVDKGQVVIMQDAGWKEVTRETLVADVLRKAEEAKPKTAAPKPKPKPEPVVEAPPEVVKAPEKVKMTVGKGVSKGEGPAMKRRSSRKKK